MSTARRSISAALLLRAAAAGAVLTMLCASAARSSEIYWTVFNGYSGLPIPPNEILRSNIDGGGIQTLVSANYGLTEFGGVAVDANTGQMFWTDDHTQSVMRANLDGSSATTIVSTGLLNPAGITVDPATGKIYWAVGGDGVGDGTTIDSANLDGSDVQQLAPLGSLGQPVGIALDTVHGKIYWTDSRKNRIVSANLDGTDMQVTYQVPFPTVSLEGIAVNPTSGKLYFAESGNSRIFSVNLNGSDPQQFVFQPSGIPLGLALDPAGNMLDWADGNYDSIYSENLGGGSQELVQSMDGVPGSIALDITPVPEPSDAILLFTGALALGGLAISKRRARRAELTLAQH